MAKWPSGTPTSLTIECLPGAVPVQICSYSFPTIIDQHSSQSKPYVLAARFQTQTSVFIGASSPHRQTTHLLKARQVRVQGENNCNDFRGELYLLGHSSSSKCRTGNTNTRVPKRWAGAGMGVGMLWGGGIPFIEKKNGFQILKFL